MVRFKLLFRLKGMMALLSLFTWSEVLSAATVEQARDELASAENCFQLERLINLLNESEIYIMIRGEMPTRQSDNRTINLRTYFAMSRDGRTGYIFKRNVADEVCKFAYISNVRLLDNRSNKVDGSVQLNGKAGSNPNSIANHITLDLAQRYFPMMQFWLNYGGDAEIVTLVGAVEGDGAMMMAGSDGIVRRKLTINGPYYLTPGKQMLDSKAPNFMTDVEWRAHAKKLAGYDSEKIDVGANVKMTEAEIERTLEYLQTEEGRNKFKEEYNKKMSSSR